MPDNDDEKIWSAYARGVKPIRRIAKEKNGGASDERTKVAAATGAIRRPAVNLPQAPIRDTKNAKPDFYAALDHKTERRLREGAVTIEARLDLHGMHQAEAHKALIGFIGAQAKACRRTLLVITGKGRSGDGILRLKLADWLAAAPVAAHILALRPAAIRHGGAGAFYVKLKKRKG